MSNLKRRAATEARAVAYRLPAATAADLWRLAARMNESPSRVASRLVSLYLAVYEETEAGAGYDAWLDRLFVVGHDTALHATVALHLPAWQVVAIRDLAEAEETRPADVLAAMLHGSLTDDGVRFTDLDGWSQRAFQALMQEHMAA